MHCATFARDNFFLDKIAFRCKSMTSSADVVKIRMAKSSFFPLASMGKTLKQIDVNERQSLTHTRSQRKTRYIWLKRVKSGIAFYSTVWLVSPLCHNLIWNLNFLPVLSPEVVGKKMAQNANLTRIRFNVLDKRLCYEFMICFSIWEGLFSNFLPLLISKWFAEAMVGERGNWLAWIQMQRKLTECIT